MTTINPFESAMKQLEKARAVLTSSEKNVKISIKIAVLTQPQRIVNVTIPVAMDDGTQKYFRVSACSLITPEVRIKAGSGITITSAWMR